MVFSQVVDMRMHICRVQEEDPWFNVVRQNENKDKGDNLHQGCSPLGYSGKVHTENVGTD